MFLNNDNKEQQILNVKNHSTLLFFKLHYSLWIKSMAFLLITIFLGIIFLILQYFELKDMALNYSDHTFATCFISIICLHGSHVFVGVILLTIQLFSLFLYPHSKSKFYPLLGFYASVIYWHFVDFIWFFVYILLYIFP